MSAATSGVYVRPAYRCAHTGYLLVWGMSVSGTIEDGMASMSAKFKEMGSSVYLDARQDLK
jgi:hypothetical protein